MLKNLGLQTCTKMYKDQINVSVNHDKISINGKLINIYLKYI